MFPRTLALPLAAFLFLSASTGANAFTVLGGGTGALLGGDLTDPENDGNDSTFNGSNFNWISVAGTSEVNFGGEGALDAFDNKVGAGNDKWCCEPPPQWLAAEFDTAYVLTHFVIAAGNDAPERDPTDWFIEGSNDGTTWTQIFHWTAGVSPFSQRLEVLRFDGNGADFPKPPPYRWFRYRVIDVDGPLHQIGELEFFGIETPAINAFIVDKPLIPAGEPVTLSWDVDPGVTALAIDQGVGSVTGLGSILVNPGPATTTTYTLTATHPEGSALESVTVTVTDQPIINAFTASATIIAPGGTITLSWQVLNGTALDLDGTDVTGTTSLVVSPASSRSYTLTATNPNGNTTRQLSIQVVVPGVPVISEFMASNDGALLVDEDGEATDWIELQNPSGSPALLDGYFLTDDPNELQKWTLPAEILAPGAYLVVFASGKNRALAGSELHTNFSLTAAGEYLALVKPDGTTIVSEFGPGGTNYPDQDPGVSYGEFGDPLQRGYFDVATPGAANSTGFLGYVKDTTFSVKRGFYSTPQSLVIASATPGATIRYTLDGRTPSETVGTVYTGPIAITRTTPVRALASKTGLRRTNVDTHTYVFVDDVITQTPATTQSTWGLPPTWGAQTPDYGMDPKVTGPHAATIRDDLKTVPSLSVVLPAADMFGSGGIYANPNSSGVAWERATSLELIDPARPDGSGDFQVDCGIRIQGGAFRNFSLTNKKSFRVLFKGIYGDTKLRFPLFGPDAAREFDSLILRMESNDGYQWDNRTDVQYARDEFNRRSALDLGIPAPHGRFLHLYINGVYWGIFNAVERPDSAFGASYFGAKKDQWDGINFGTATNEGSTAYWNTLVSLAGAIPGAGTESARTAAFMKTQGLNPDGSNNPAFADFVNIDNYIDYLLVNWYTGNNDWPHRNYYSGRERDLIDPPGLRGTRTSTGTHFFMWDGETSMFLNSSNDKTGDTSGVAVPYGSLRASKEFRLRIADRAHRALFNGGALTPGPSIARYADITRDHRSFLIPELARWGDQHGVLRTIAQWQSAYNNVRDNWLAVRTPAFVNVLRNAGFYPDLAAPFYSQHGGSVPPGGGPTLIVPTTISDIYYAFGPGDADPTDYADALDPRLPGGGLNPAATHVVLNGGGGGPVTTRYLRSGDTWSYLDDASDQGTAWRAKDFDHSAWPTGPTELGYGDGDEAQVVNFVDTDPVTAGDQKNATTYFRKTVTIPDPTVFGDFTLGYLFDDAIAVYVNGVEVARRNLVANAAFNTFATGSSGDNARGTVTLAPAMFVAGSNTIAAEVHQNIPTSSDLSFDLDLTGNPPGGADTHASEPLVLTEPGWLLSRSYDSATGEWSALNRAFFSIDTVPADASNLVTSELHYRPAEPVAAGEIAVATDRDDYEFLELLNISAQTIDLTGVRLTQGVTFDFAENTLLAAGARIVVVKNLGAFTARYGAGGFVVAGEFSGNLNNDGERLLLASTVTGAIRDFTYNDQPPWPTAPDGDGFSLVLVAPQTNPDHNVPANWRSSTVPNGNPGSTDSVTFAAWKLVRDLIDDDGDPDHDGLNNFGEFASGTAHDRGSAGQLPAARTLAIGADTYLAIDIRRSLAAADEAELEVATSPDLAIWTADAVYIGEAHHADGLTATVTYRAPNPITPGQTQFLRATYRSR